MAEAADGIATGYITFDVVNDCSLLFPGNPGYFADGGTGIASNANVLWGDYFLADPANAFAQGDQLVHIEAMDSVQSGFWDPGDYTFYGRYLTFDASDNREPLATTWATRYFSGTAGPFNDDSDILCWRDSGLDDSAFFRVRNGTGALSLESESDRHLRRAGEPRGSSTARRSRRPRPRTRWCPCACASTRANAADFGGSLRFRLVLPQPQHHHRGHSGPHQAVLT